MIEILFAVVFVVVVVILVLATSSELQIPIRVKAAVGLIFGAMVGFGIGYGLVMLWAGALWGSNVLGSWRCSQMFTCANLDLIMRYFPFVTAFIGLLLAAGLAWYSLRNTYA